MLTGQVAAVTGAGRNIGRGIAERFAANGASVAVLELDEDRAEMVVEGLATGDGQDHVAIATDVTNPDAVERADTAIDDRYGSLDVLVNNLGYAANKSIFEVTYEEWDRVMDMTIRSTFLCSKLLGERIAATGGGSIINLVTGLGHKGAPEKVAYCTAKAGVLNMTRALSLDYADHGVRVNSISPGLVGDPVGRTTGREDRNPDRIPLGRLGRPEDVGNAAVFLASELSDYVTGADIPVAGGL